MPSFITVDPERCIACLACIEGCPVRLFRLDRRGHARAAAYAEAACLDCGHCLALCPTEAIAHGRIKAGPPAPKPDIPPADLLDFLTAQRSTREFLPETPGRAPIEAAIDAARFAPSAKNIQPVSWRILEGRERLSKLSPRIVEALADDPFAQGIGAFLTRGIDLVMRGAPLLVLALGPTDAPERRLDVALALDRFDLGVRAQGFGTCWAGLVMRAADRDQTLARDLNPREDRSIHGAMLVGVPKRRFFRLPERKNAEIEWC